MREKIADLIKEDTSMRDSRCLALADAILAAIGDGQEPVGYQFQDRDGKWHSFMDDRHMKDTISDGSWPVRAVYAAPKPAPDVAAFEWEVSYHDMYIQKDARIAELERLLSDARSAANDFNDEAHKLTGKVAELERAQGVLVGALEKWHSTEHEQLPRHAPEPCLCSQCQFVRARRAALAAVQKPEGAQHD